MMSNAWLMALAAILAQLSGPLARAEEAVPPGAETKYPVEVFWGDTHLHTTLSADSYVSNQRLTPDDAYRFALGQTIRGPNNEMLRRHRALDFLVVADHAENLGFLNGLESADPLLLKSKVGKAWYEKFDPFLAAIRARDQRAVAAWYEVFKDVLPQENHEGFDSLILHRYLLQYAVAEDSAFRQSLWDGVVARAEQYNDPGNFTAFIGYEWTPITFFDHRVVIFNGGPEGAGQTLPFTAIDSKAPEDLWAYFESYREKTGGDVLGIPHNGNLTRGHMFLPEDSSGRPLSRHYAETRARWEPLVEVTQIKGDSETHPSLSPNDEFADFETWLSYDPGEDRGRRYEYAREALKAGLGHQATLGVNPFKFGMIGSTDNHRALPGPEEKGLSDFIPGMASPTHLFETVGSDRNYWSAGGYAAIWALENTRASLFAAMKRREVYATTGPRMRVRFFGGWDYAAEDAQRSNLASIGYSGGVPMGGDLARAPRGKAPRFLIQAVKDPEGANLDRVQVIKGWRSKDGNLHEQIYNVALSDGRNEGADGKVEPVGSTVDVGAARYTNSIGDAELTTVWTDPDFDTDESAFYYLRVLEIPTPRWTTYYASRVKPEDIPPDFPMVIQERAYTSPIWYTP